MRKRIFALMMCFCMVFANVTPVTALAQNIETACENHTEHTAECGYSEGTAEIPCTHICDDGCTAPVTSCVHTHDDGCGYAPAAEASPCTHRCESCVAEPEPNLVCTCETDDPAIHSTLCPGYEAPENPDCFCVEQCPVDAPNEWCDICGVQGAVSCKGNDITARALAADEQITVTIEVDFAGYIQEPFPIQVSGATRSYTFSSGYTYIVNGTICDDMNVYNYGTIAGGTFDGEVMHVAGAITGGTFNGLVTNYGTIEGGTFTGGILNMGGTLPENVQDTVAQGGDLAITIQNLGTGAITVKQKGIDIPSGKAREVYNVAASGGTLAGLYLLTEGEAAPTEGFAIEGDFRAVLGGAGGYDFTMPNEPVTILAVFSDYDPSADTTAPTLTAGEVNRTGAREATVKFTSSEAGEYYYAVVSSDVIVPNINTSGTGTNCGATEQTITLTNLPAEGTQYIYIKVKDTAGNVSNALKITIPAYVPTTGPFTVTGGEYDVDYVYEPESGDSNVMVLEVKTTIPLTIKNTDPTTPTQHRIKVTAEGATVTLAGVNIDRTSAISYAAFEVNTGEAADPVIIILADGSTNTLISGADSAGLQNNSSPILITCESADTPGHGCGDSCGRLKAPRVNNSVGAGIGGQEGAEGSNIAISGGNITAEGAMGAGIGGGNNGSASNITISGGNVTATSITGAGIGVGYNGGNPNDPPNRSILCISPKLGYQIEVLEGLRTGEIPSIFTSEWDITSYLTGGTFQSVTTPRSYTVTNSLTDITSDGVATATYGTAYTATLTADAGYTLPDSITVTVGGTALTSGTDYTWSGGVLTIDGASIIGDIVITAEAVPVPVLTVTAPTFAEVAEGYAQPTAKAITITNNGNATVNIANVEANNTNFTIDGSGSSVAAGSSIDTWTVQPSANLGVGTHTATITVTYDGGKTATATVSFTVAAAAPNTYTVTFNSNGGTGTMAAQTFTHGVTQSLTANSFTRSGYAFTGWNTEASGGGTAYSDGQSVTLTTGGLTLYAQWQKADVSTKTEAQTFDANDITDELRDKGYTTPEQIETVLKTQITQTGVPSSNTAFYDIVLLYSDDGGNTWIEADEEHFPNNGQLPISIPVPNGVNANTHDFYGIHMFSKTAFGKIAGDTENVVFTERTENGTVYLDGFVNGLSPILVGWKTTGGTDPDPAPSITGVTVSPSTATVNKGSTRQFTATVTGTGNYNTAVTWSISGNISRGTTISATGILTVDSAENASVLTVTATAVGDTTKSASVVVTVQYVEPAEGVKIISPTTDQTITVVEGDTATMRITAENAIGYQWHVDRNDGNGFVAIDGANDSVYTTSATAPANDGYRYYCGAYNDISPADSPIFTLRVIAGYTVRVSASPTEGGSVTGAGAYTEGASVTVTATANDGYKFLRWMENGSDVSTNASYTFTVTTDRTLVAVFEEKEDDVDPIIPDPENPPVITSPTKDQTVNVYVGDKATMSVKATDADSYQWYVDRGNGFEAILGVTGASYTTSAASLENDGYRYYCVAINAYGTDTSPIFTLNVKKDAVIPVTGDSSQPGLWIVLMMIALAGLAICAVMWRRSRKYNHQ